MPSEFVVKYASTIWGDLTTAIAAFAAIIAAVCADFSYHLSKRIYNEIKSDEVVVTGPLHHHELRIPEHFKCVFWCTIFNKSQKKAYINDVKTFDLKGKSVKI